MRCTLFLLNPVLPLLLLQLFNYIIYYIPTNYLLLATAFIFFNFLRWPNCVRNSEETSHLKRENKYLRDKIDRVTYGNASKKNPSSVNQQRRLESLREFHRRQAVGRIQTRQLQPTSKQTQCLVKPYQRLVTEAVYRPPVRSSRILYHHKRQAYQRFKLRPVHRPKRSKPPIDWRTQAKESNYERRTPVWPSKVRHYPDEYKPAVGHPFDVKLRNDEYHPSALDSAAISTLELLKTHNNFKKKKCSSLNMKNGSLFNHLNEIHRERFVSYHPSVVPSLWETDRYQSNRRVQELCDKLGNLTDNTRQSIYPISTAEMSTIYKRYLNHRLSILRHCHGGKDKYKKHTYNDTMCVVDTGASIGLTPYRADFIDYLPLEGATIKDISKVNNVLGVGTVMWKLKSRRGDEVFIPCVAYHMPECDIRLMSPQCYFQAHGGHAEMTEHMVTIYLPGIDKHIIDVPIDKETNLPAIMQPQTTKEQQLQFGPHLLSTIIANNMILDDITHVDPKLGIVRRRGAKILLSYFSTLCFV